MTFCHAARKGGHIGSHWPNHFAPLLHSMLFCGQFNRRFLAYSIAGETHAVYRVYTLELPSEAPAAISSVLNITDEVVRYLLSKVDAKAQAVLAEEKTRKVASTDTTDEK